MKTLVADGRLPAVPIPAQREREAILRQQTRTWPVPPDANLTTVASIVSGFTQPELVRLCHEAARCATSAVRQQVTLADFTEATEKLLLQGARLVLWDAYERLQVAYHEASHLLVSWVTPAAQRLISVSIFPAGRYAPRAAQRWSDASSACWQAELDVLLAGYVAEELRFELFTPHAVLDVIAATEHIIRRAARLQATQEDSVLLAARCRGLRILLEKQRPHLDHLADLLAREESLEEAALDFLLRDLPASTMRSPATG